MQCTCFDKLLKQEFCVSVCTVLIAREFTGMYQQVSILGNVEVYSFEQESQEIHKPVFIKLNEKKLELRCFSFFYLGAYFRYNSYPKELHYIADFGWPSKKNFIFQSSVGIGNGNLCFFLLGKHRDLERILDGMIA